MSFLEGNNVFAVLPTGLIREEPVLHVFTCGV